MCVRRAHICADPHAWALSDRRSGRWLPEPVHPANSPIKHCCVSSSHPPDTPEQLPSPAGERDRRAVRDAVDEAFTNPSQSGRESPQTSAEPCRRSASWELVGN